LSPGPFKIPYAARCVLAITSIFSLLWPHTVSGLSIYDVITLSQNKYKAGEIVDIMLATGSAFTLTATDVVYLKKASVNDSVVQAMLVVVPPKSQETDTISIRSTDWLNLTLGDLLVLADNDISDTVILSFIKTRKRSFTLSASEIVKLRKAGLSDVAIQYLLSETNAIDGPVNYYEPPTNSMGPYLGTVILDRYPSVIPFDVYPLDVYPRYYYGPSIYIGFSNINHTLFNHQHVGLHHDGKKHHVGSHHRSDHHIGSHDIGKDQHVGQHHRTPEHIRSYHSVKNSDTQLTSVNKSHSVNNNRNHSVPRTTRHSTKVTSNNSGRSMNRTNKYSKSPKSNQNVKRKSGNTGSRVKPQ